MLPASIRAWYDETTFLSPEALEWNDRSGLSRHLWPGAGEGLLAGTRKGRRTTQFLGDSYVARDFSNNQPCTLLIAVKFGVWAGATVYLADGGATNARIEQRAATVITVHAGTDLNATFSQSLSNRWVVIAVVFDGANSRVYEDGILRASGNAGTNNPAGLTLGAGRTGLVPIVAEIGEVLILAGAQTATVVGEASRYLMRKWV